MGVSLAGDSFGPLQFSYSLKRFTRSRSPSLISLAGIIGTGAPRDDAVDALARRGADDLLVEEDHTGGKLPAHRRRDRRRVEMHDDGFAQHVVESAVFDLDERRQCGGPEVERGIAGARL